MKIGYLDDEFKRITQSWTVITVFNVKFLSQTTNFYINQAITYQEERIQDLQEEMGLLRTLATTGIVVNTYIHEIKALTTQLNVGVKEAYACLEEDNDMSAAKDELKKLRILKDKFNSWFKVTLGYRFLEILILIFFFAAIRLLFITFCLIPILFFPPFLLLRLIFVQFFFRNPQRLTNLAVGVYRPIKYAGRLEYQG